METPPRLSAKHTILSLPRKKGQIRRMAFEIPDICQFWYTIALFRPVKVHPKVCEFITKLTKIGHNRPKLRVLNANKYTGLKYTIAGAGGID